MTLLASYRAEQLITQLVSEEKPDSPAAKRMADRLKRIGPKVIPKAIDALALSDKSHTMLFVDILTSLVNDKSTGVLLTNAVTFSRHAALLSPPLALRPHRPYRRPAHRGLRR